MHQIHLHGKMIHYGTKIAYIYVRIPTQTKGTIGIAHLSSRRALRIFENLP
jgi:hypothetical protein